MATGFPLNNTPVNASKDDHDDHPDLTPMHFVWLGAGLTALLCAAILVQVACLLMKRRRKKKYDTSKPVDRKQEPYCEGRDGGDTPHSLVALADLETRSLSSGGRSWEAWTLHSEDLSEELEMSHPEMLEEEVRELIGKELLLVLGPRPCPVLAPVIDRTPDADDVIDGGYVSASHVWPVKETMDTCTQTEAMLGLSSIL